MERLGLGVDRGQLTEEEDEFSTYRKRMMLSYKFRPNPMVSLNMPSKQGFEMPHMILILLFHSRSPIIPFSEKSQTRLLLEAECDILDQ